MMIREPKDCGGGRDRKVRILGEVKLDSQGRAYIEPFPPEMFDHPGIAEREIEDCEAVRYFEALAEAACAEALTEQGKQDLAYAHAAAVERKCRRAKPAIWILALAVAVAAVGGAMAFRFAH
jgi:hypothetical protein